MRYNYNLSGSGRKPLVEAISQILDKPAIYQGAPSFAYTVGDYTIDRSGVLSYGSNIHPDFAAVLIRDLQERGFLAESINDAADDAATEGNVNNADDSETTDAAVTEGNTVATADVAVTDNTASTGVVTPKTPDILTIEVPDTDFTPEALENLRKIVKSKETLIKKALETDKLPIVAADGKISFAWFTLHGLPSEADAYSRLIAAICKMAKTQKRVTAKEKPSENEKFDMRLFLVRLGFIGDAYKDARKILLRNLTGNASWKSGHKPERNTDAVIPPNPAEATMPTEQELATPLEETDLTETEPQKEDEEGEVYGK